MRFFIRIGNQWVERKANLMAVSEDVKDETLDTAKLDVMADDREKPYDVRSYCKLTIGDETKYYRLATDNVSVFSLSPLTYKHSLSLVQATRELSHHILPNMVITKPREKTRKAFFSTTNTLNLQHYWTAVAPTQGLALWDGFMGANFDLTADGKAVARNDLKSRYWSEPFACSKNEKIENGELRIAFKALKPKSLDATSLKAKSSFVTLHKVPSIPLFLKVYAVVYHTATNTSRALWDADIKERTDIATIELTNQSWQGDYLVLNLTQSQVDAINGYDGGYIAIDIKSDVVGTLPTALADARSVTDRLFADVKEFTQNGYEYIVCNMELAFTYKRTFLYDTLKRIIAREQAEYASGNKKPLFTLPTSGADYEELATTESPEFSFSGQTVFEAVSQVLSTIDALPDFDATENADGSVTDILKLDRLNERGKEYGDTRVAGISHGLGEEKYVNGILTEFQKAETLRKFPSGVEGTYTNVRLKGYGVPELKDFAMVLDKPIKYLNKLEVKTSVSFQVAMKNAEGTYVKATSEIDLPIDLSSFAYEESVYSSALSDRGEYTNDNHNERLQMNCLKFSKGSKNIDLGNKATNAYNKVYLTFWNCWKAAFDRMFGAYATNTYTAMDADQTPWFSYNLPTEGDYSSVWFRCEYASDVDGRVIVASPTKKADGEMYASAQGASIDLGKLGLNMVGLSMRTGVPTMTCNQVISYWDKRIRKGMTIERDGFTWVANKCQYQTISQSGKGYDIIKGTIEFTRDFNGLAKRIAIDQNKRYSNISPSIVDKCEVNIVNYATLGVSQSANALFTQTDGATPIDVDDLARFIGKPFGVSFAGANVGGSLKEPLDVDFARYYLEPQSSGVRDVFMPITVYGAGNCVCFEASFDDAISAGVRMDVSAEDNGKWWYPWQDVTQTKRYFGKDVKYADGEGYADVISIDYVSGKGANFPSTFPYIPNSGTNKVGSLLGLRFDKMPNEIIAVNYEMAFVAKDEGIGNLVFMGKRFFDLVSQPMRQTGCRLYLGVKDDSKDERYSLLDAKAKGTAYEINSIQAFKADDATTANPYRDYYLKVTLPSGVSIPEKDYRSYCLADEEGNILVACNYAFKANSDSPLPIVHFTTSPERLE